MRYLKVKQLSEGVEMAKKVSKNKRKKNSLKLLFINLKRSLGLYWKIDKRSFLGLLITIISLALIPFIYSYFWGQALNLIV